MGQKKQHVLSGHVNQCTHLKMSAVTLLPVLPPNWKLGVGSSCTNSNPMMQHRGDVQVKKCAFCKLQYVQYAVLNTDAKNLFLLTMATEGLGEALRVKNYPSTICGASWGLVKAGCQCDR